MKYREIPIDQVIIPDTRVTSYFNPEVLEQFKRTIETVGVIEPIVVVEAGEKYYLVDGLHRLAEVKAGGVKDIPAVVIPGDEKDVFLTNLFLNVLRGKPKVGEIRGTVELLYSEYKVGVEQISEKTGIGCDFIHELLDISGLPEEIGLAFDEGRLAKGKALAIARLPPPELQLRVFYYIDCRNFTVRDVEEIVNQLLEEAGKQPPPPPAPGPPEVRKMTCDWCHKEFEKERLKSVLLCEGCESVARGQ